MTPNVAHQIHEENRNECLLDIDKRFNYLPKFRYYDMTKPSQINDKFRLLILDPPFFIIPIEQIARQ